MQGGAKGLWKGWVPNCQRAALVQLGDLTTYDAAKQFLLREVGVKVRQTLDDVSSLRSAKLSRVFSMVSQ